MKLGSVAAQLAAGLRLGPQALSPVFPTPAAATASGTLAQFWQDPAVPIPTVENVCAPSPRRASEAPQLVTGSESTELTQLGNLNPAT